jgi:hypothetical protein
MITGRLWKIKRIKFDLNWYNWTFGICYCPYLRKTDIQIGPLTIEFYHERIVTIDRDLST